MDELRCRRRRDIVETERGESCVSMIYVRWMSGIRYTDLVSCLCLNALAGNLELGNPRLPVEGTGTVSADSWRHGEPDCERRGSQRRTGRSCTFRLHFKSSKTRCQFGIVSALLEARPLVPTHTIGSTDGSVIVLAAVGCELAVRVLPCLLKQLLGPARRKVNGNKRGSPDCQRAWRWLERT